MALRTILVLFGLPMFAFGFLCSVGIGVVMLQGSNTVYWPQVQGQVVASSIDVRQSTRQGKPLSRYKPIVEYAYQVNGGQHTSTRIAYGVTKRFEDRKEIETFLAEYPIGVKVPVYYSPRSPRTSVVKPGLKDSSGYFVALAITGGTSMLVPWMIIAAFRGRRVKSKKPMGRLAHSDLPRFGRPASAG